MFSQSGEAFPLGNAASHSECLKTDAAVPRTGACARGAGAAAVAAPEQRFGALCLAQVLVVIKPLTSGQVTCHVGL